MMKLCRIQGSTVSPPLPERIPLLAVFNRRPWREQSLKSLAQVAGVEKLGSKVHDGQKKSFNPASVWSWIPLLLLVLCAQGIRGRWPLLPKHPPSFSAGSYLREDYPWPHAWRLQRLSSVARLLPGSIPGSRRGLLPFLWRTANQTV